MMQKVIHRSDERGFADHGWLKATHSFSFGNYYRQDRMNFGLLRVLNDDEVAPGMGFGTHPHDNMEIVTVPLEGVVAHRDSMGHQENITPGEVQAMSAGTGITHSEFNASKSEYVRLLQLWVVPRERGVTPQYDQKLFRLNQEEFTILASPDRRNDSLLINQDAVFSRGKISAGQSSTYTVHFPGNGVYNFVIDGKALIAGEQLGRRDAIGISGSESIEMVAEEDLDVLCVEVPMI